MKLHQGRAGCLLIAVTIGLLAFTERASCQSIIHFAVDEGTQIASDGLWLSRACVQLLWAPADAAGLTFWHAETSTETPAEWFSQNPDWTLLPAFQVTFYKPVDLPIPVQNGTKIQLIALVWTDVPVGFEWAYASGQHVGTGWGPIEMDVGTDLRYPADFGPTDWPLYLWQVPEPSTPSLCGFGAALLLWRRRATLGNGHAR